MDLGAAPVVPHPSEMGELVQLSWSRACAKPSPSWEHQPAHPGFVSWPGELLGSSHSVCSQGTVLPWGILQLLPFLVWNPWSWGMPHLGVLGTPWTLPLVGGEALRLISELGKGQGSLRGNPRSSLDPALCEANLLLLTVAIRSRAG